MSPKQKYGSPQGARRIELSTPGKVQADYTTKQFRLFCVSPNSVIGRLVRNVGIQCHMNLEIEVEKVWPVDVEIELEQPEGKMKNEGIQPLPAEGEEAGPVEFEGIQPFPAEEGEAGPLKEVEAVNFEFFGLSQTETQSLEDWLKAADVFDDFCVALKQLSSGNLHARQIAVLTFLECTKFQSLASTTCMWYSAETKSFWTAMYYVGGGLALRLVSGPKNFDQILSGEARPGFFDPYLAKANFAVPHPNVLNKGCAALKQNVEPGLLPEMLDIAQKLAEQGTRFTLSFDLKSLTPGIRKPFGEGDVHFFGTDIPLLSQSREQLELLVESARTMPKRLEEGKFGSACRGWAVKLTRLAQDIVGNLKHAEQFKAKLRARPMAKNKLDFAISKWNVKSIDNQECLIQIRSAIKSLAALSSLYSNAPLCVEDELQFSSLRNVVALEKSKGISSAFPSIALYDACGLRGLKAAKKNLREPAADQVLDNRDLLVATLAGRGLPLLFPPCFSLLEQSGSPAEITVEGTSLLAVLQDGIVKCTSQECTDHPDDHFTSSVFYLPPGEKDAFMFPIEFVLEACARIVAQGTKSCISARLCGQNVVLHSVRMDPQDVSNLLEKALGVLKEMSMNKGARKVDSVQLLQEEVQKAHEHFYLLSELPAVQKVHHNQVSVPPQKMPATCPNLSEIDFMRPVKQGSIEKDHSSCWTTPGRKLQIAMEDFVPKLCILLEQIAKLYQEEAVDIGVFMLQDMDQKSEARLGYPAAFPVGYCMKGSTITPSQV